MTRRFLRRRSATTTCRTLVLPPFRRGQTAGPCGVCVRAGCRVYVCTRYEGDGPTGEYLQEVKQKGIPGGP